MALFRKKPVVIEAMPFREVVKMDPVRKDYNSAEIASFIGKPIRTVTEPDGTPEGKNFLEIPTLEGVMRASVGDYIIKGVKGEFYPCKPDIFRATYEEVSETAADEPFYELSQVFRNWQKEWDAYDNKTGPKPKSVGGFLEDLKEKFEITRK